ncbi:MAG: biopolymer transporter ExbD [Elusimicrobia bacterium]|nr:biopolymer transporter ExbD [Elusimicrobiota bacterium]
MKIVTKRKRLASMESIALTDIIMNMFIFFFVSFSLLYTFNPVKQVNIPVNLPKSQTAQPDKTLPLEITVTRTGQVYVGNQVVSLNNVKGAVTAHLRKNPERVVLLRADEGVNYGRAIQVLDQARQAGAQKLGLAAKEEKK